MEYEKPLSDLYKQYRMGEMSKKDLEGKMFRYLLDHFDKYRFFRGNRDKWDEFLSWLYPRISRAIDLYKDFGSSMDAYISALIKGAAKEYFHREVNHYLTEYACWRAKAEEIYLHENEPVYTESVVDCSIPGDLKPRQVLFLLLKSYFYASDELIKQVTMTIGMDTEGVKKMIDKLHRMRSEQEAEILNMREHLQCQYYRCLAYQKRMQSSFQGTEYYEELKDRFDRAMRRFYRMKKRLEGMRKGPSNRMIAEVVGIPKGTVDSGLFTIKNRLNTAGFSR